ncbi:hypothetical protein BaRGS_00012361 [Batillaria attramentaria]|uniref:Uncharacterized protein n=1 Tax=Batillaria attramentaria TaxID=370345 RepID=A0ABD0LAH1_9CAEN
MWGEGGGGVEGRNGEEAGVGGGKGDKEVVVYTLANGFACNNAPKKEDKHIFDSRSYIDARVAWASDSTQHRQPQDQNGTIPPPRHCVFIPKSNRPRSPARRQSHYRRDVQSFFTAVPV